jgi:predicted PurR-regulated permease PerM
LSHGGVNGIKASLSLLQEASGLGSAVGERLMVAVLVSDPQWIEAGTAATLYRRRNFMQRDDERSSEYIIGEKIDPLPPRAHLQMASLSVVGLLLLAAVYTVYFAKPFLMPVVFALLISLVLRPIHRRLRKLGLPHIVAAIVVMVALVGTTVAVIYALSAPVATWAGKLPEELRRVEYRMRALRAPVERMTEVADQVDQLTTMEQTAAGPPVVELRQQTVSQTLFRYAGSFAGYTAVTFVLVFFMLAFGDAFYRQLGKHEATVAVFHEISDSVSRYLLTITVINIGLGISVGVAMFLIGMPSPVLWAVMATVFNFIPFLGAMVGMGVVTIAAALTFSEISRILLVPITFFALTALEGSFITPTILGRRFTVNPIVIFVWVVLWGWIWAVPGALIAVPLLMALKIVFDNVGRLHWISDLISYQSVVSPVKKKPAPPDEDRVVEVVHR